MGKRESITQVYTPKPGLTIYRDTYLKCELVEKDVDAQCRLKVISVHTGKGGLLSDLTAEHVDEVIFVDNEDVYHSVEEMKEVLRNHI